MKTVHIIKALWLMASKMGKVIFMMLWLTWHMLETTLIIWDMELELIQATNSNIHLLTMFMMENGILTSEKVTDSWSRSTSSILATLKMINTMGMESTVIKKEQFIVVTLNEEWSMELGKSLIKMETHSQEIS